MFANDAMLKITKTLDSATDVHLKLEGRIVGQWAWLLDGTCRAHLREKKAVELDCAGVEFIDALGAEVLKNLPRKRVTTRELLSASYQPPTGANP